VIAREDLVALFDLQSQTIERVHPSWLPDISPELSWGARGSPAGRRWLANRLSQVSSSLFSLPVDSDPAAELALHPTRWFMILLKNPLECALDLGSLALAASVRRVITRVGVSRLRAVLGEPRYERVLSAPTPPAAGASCVHSIADPALVSGDITQQLTRCGAHELAGYATYLHPALADSVKLSFECNWWDIVPPPLLAPSVAEACLRVRASHSGDGDD
jgi:hypothetical protein